MEPKLHAGDSTCYIRHLASAREPSAVHGELLKRVVDLWNNTPEPSTTPATDSAKIRAAGYWPPKLDEDNEPTTSVASLWQMQAQDLAIQLKAAIDDRDQADRWGKACAAELERLKNTAVTAREELWKAVAQRRSEELERAQAELAKVIEYRAPGKTRLAWGEVSPEQLDSLMKGLKEPNDEPCIEVRTLMEWIGRCRNREARYMLEELCNYLLDVEPIGKLEPRPTTPPTRSDWRGR